MKLGDRLGPPTARRLAHLPPAGLGPLDGPRTLSGQLMQSGNTLAKKSGWGGGA
jgi:hypothetical protein